MKKWIRFWLCLAGIFLFVKLCPLLLSQNSTYKQLTDRSEKLGIDNAALFYSEEAKTATAEKALKDRLGRQ